MLFFQKEAADDVSGLIPDTQSKASILHRSFTMLLKVGRCLQYSQDSIPITAKSALLYPHLGEFGNATMDKSRKVDLVLRRVQVLNISGAERASRGGPMGLSAQ